MKAIVTIINDDGDIIEKDKVLTPCDEYITNYPSDIIPTKTTVFRFSITEALNQHQKIYFGKEENE